MTIRIPELRSPRFGEVSPRATRDERSADFSGTLRQEVGNFGASGIGEAQALRGRGDERRGRLDVGSKRGANNAEDAGQADPSRRLDESLRSDARSLDDTAAQPRSAGEADQIEEESWRERDQAVTGDATPGASDQESSHDALNQDIGAHGAATAPESIDASAAALGLSTDSPIETKGATSSSVHAGNAGAPGGVGVDASGLGADAASLAGNPPSARSGEFNTALVADTSPGQGEIGGDDETAGSSRPAPLAPQIAASSTATSPTTPRGNDLLQALAPPSTNQHPIASAASIAPSAPGNDPAGADDAQAANAARVARALHSAVNQNGGAVTIRLTPPELGFVRVQVELRDGAASVQFQSDQEAARGLLSNQLGALRGALERQGLTVTRLEVQPLTPPAGFSDARFQSPTDDGRSRGGFADDSAQRQPSRRTAQDRDDADTAFSDALVNTIG